MIEIKNMSRDFSKVERYLLTLSPAMVSIKDVSDGTSLRVNGYCEFRDIDEETGDIVELLSIITPNKEVYACQSTTFKKSLHDIAALFEPDEEFSIIKRSGKTKANRDFINCELDISTLQ